MGMPNSVGNFAWGCQIPCSVGDTKSTEGVPKSLGDLARGCRIPNDTGSDAYGRRKSVFARFCNLSQVTNLLMSRFSGMILRIFENFRDFPTKPELSSLETLYCMTRNLTHHAMAHAEHGTEFARNLTKSL